MKDSNKIKNILIVTLIIIIIVLFVIINIFIKNDKTNNEKTKIAVTSKKKSEIKNIDIQNNEMVNIFNRYNSMYDYLDMLKYDGTSYFDYFYRNDKVDSDNLDENVKFMITVYNTYGNILENTEIIKGAKEKIDEDSMKLFGSKINYKKISSKSYQGKLLVGAVNGYSIMYEDNNSDFYIEEAGLGGVTSLDYVLKKTKAYKNGDYLIIENVIMFTYQETDDPVKLFKTAGDLSNYSSSKNINSLSLIDEIAYNKEINIDNYEDKLDTFRWTFKKDKNNNYTFYSVEKIK